MRRLIQTVALTLCITSLFSACSGAETSAGMVLENAGGVVRQGGDKLWVDPNGPTPTPSSERRY